jgi:Cft2 family RNA processing exonuclease
MSNQTKELKYRIGAKKHELMARLAELAADTHAEAGEQTAKIKARLDELEVHLKEGWDKATHKLDEWLNRN